MKNDSRPNEDITADPISPEDLQGFFENIEDHLAFWNVLYTDRVGGSFDWHPVPLERTRAVTDWLNMDSAPLNPSASAQGIRGLIYRVLNVPVKVFGRPQIRFNQKLREFLSKLLPILEMYNAKDAALYERIEQNTDRIRELETENAAHRSEIALLSQQVAELTARLDGVNTENLPGKRD